MVSPKKNRSKISHVGRLTADLWRGGLRMIDGHPGHNCTLLHMPNVWQFRTIEQFYVFPQFFHPEIILFTFITSTYQKRFLKSPVQCNSMLNICCV